jgi:hypothetical protein
MADRDKIPVKVPSQFRGVYQQICELQTPESVAQSVLRPLRETAKSFRDAPVELIKRASIHLKPMSGNSMLPKISDWDNEYQKVQELKDDIEGDHDGIDLAARGCHQTLIKLENGEQIDDIPFDLAKNYIMSIYDSQLHENIIHSDVGDEGIDDQKREEYLNVVRSCVSDSCESLARQLARNFNVNGITLPNRTQKTEDMLDTDIMQGLV